MPLWSQHDHAVSTLRPALTEAGLFYISRTLNPAQLLVSKIDGVAAETHPPFGRLPPQRSSQTSRETRHHMPNR